MSEPRLSTLLGLTPNEARWLLRDLVKKGGLEGVLSKDASTFYHAPWLRDNLKVRAKELGRFELGLLVGELNLEPAKVTLLLQTLVEEGDLLSLEGGSYVTKERLEEETAAAVGVKLRGAGGRILLSEVAAQMGVGEGELRARVEGRAVRGGFDPVIYDGDSLATAEYVAGVVEGLGRVRVGEFCSEHKLPETALLSCVGKVVGTLSLEGSEFVTKERLRAEMADLVKGGGPREVPSIAEALRVEMGYLEALIEKHPLPEGFYYHREGKRLLLEADLPDQILEALTRSRRTDLKTLAPTLSAPPDKVRGLVERLLKEKRVEGFLDEAKGEFVHFAKEDSDRLAEKIKEAGAANIALLAEEMGLREEQLRKLAAGLIPRGKVRGFLSEDGGSVYTRDYLKEKLSEQIQSSKRVSLAGFAEEFGIPQKSVLDIAVLLMSEGRAKGKFLYKTLEFYTLSEEEQGRVVGYVKGREVTEIKDLTLRFGLDLDLLLDTLLDAQGRGELSIVVSRDNSRIFQEGYLERLIEKLMGERRTVNLPALAEEVKILPEGLWGIIERLRGEGRLSGFLDPASNHFFYLDPEEEERIISHLTSKGFIELGDLAAQLQILSHHSRRILDLLVEKFRVRGVYAREGGRFITVDYALKAIEELASRLRAVTVWDVIDKLSVTLATAEEMLLVVRYREGLRRVSEGVEKLEEALPPPLT